MKSFMDYAGTIAKIVNSEGDLSLLPAPSNFPFPTAYKGQLTAVELLMNVREALLSSHTGSGKSPVFLTQTVGRPSMVVEPRKFLQNQIAKYRNDVVMFGRGSYPCFYAQSAATAPCRGKKWKEDDETYFVAFDPVTGKQHDQIYPCPGCPYSGASTKAQRAITSGKTVIVNFGNFWRFLPFAEVVILDEADLFFQSISSGKRLKYIDQEMGKVSDTLAYEATLVENQLKSLKGQKARNQIEGTESVKKINELENHLQAITGMAAQSDICFQYVKDNKVYVEIKPSEINTLKERLFPRKLKNGAERKLIIVTATPSSFIAETTISYEVFQRTAVFYTPVGLMTVRNVGMHPEVLKNCAKFIVDTHAGFKRMFDEEARKTVVHCASIAYANKIAEYIGPEKCDIHKSGRLMEVVEGFKTSDAEYLLACAMEYGGDFDYIVDQYIVKVLYASLDERLQAYQKQIGKKEFDDWYSMDAMNRIVQASGRAGRGAGALGFTFICDQMFGLLYGRYYRRLPSHFINRLRRSGTI